MNDLPVLLPMWPNISLKNSFGKRHYGTDASTYPDHTGAGVDISFRYGFRECIEFKSPTVRHSMAAKCCALPFLPPNKVRSLRDPCIQTLKIQREKQRIFCMRVDRMMAYMKSKQDFNDDVHTAYSDVNSTNNVEECLNITVPRKVLDVAGELPENFPVPRANWLYTNGCLTTLPSEEESEGLLFHPGGIKMNKFVVTPYKETSSKRKTIVACEEYQKSLKFNGDKIYQIETAATQGTRLCCVRQKETYHLVNLDEPEENEDFPFLFESFSLPEEISSIALSPYVPGQHSIITKNGLLFIQDANSKETLWQVDEPLVHEPIVVDMWWGCGFGRSYPSLMCMDRSNLTVFDIRQKKKPSVLLSSFNPFFLQNEMMMIMRHWPGNDYQHLVASNYHLFICDERYPEQPVIVMNHMMKGFPMYCAVAPYNSRTLEYVVCLGSQEKREIAAHFLQPSISVVQPLSLGQPLHLSDPRDCVDSLRLHGHNIKDSVVQRLSLPLIGVDVIPHVHKPGFTVLQVSSLGDIFSQSFMEGKETSEKTWKVGPGCVLTPPKRILPDLSSWMDLAVVKEKRKMNKKRKKRWQTIDKSDVLSRVLVVKGRSTRCAVCKDRTLLEGEEEVDCETCPSCGLQSEISEKIMNARKHGGVIPSFADSNSIPELKLVDLSKCMDPFSKKLLKPWEDEDFTFQKDDHKTQPLSTILESDHGIGREPWPSGPSIEHIAANANPRTTNSDIEKDSSRTPSIDGLSMQRNTDILDNTICDDYIVPPSQDIRPVIGETLRTPKFHRKKIKIHSSAGF